MGAGSKGCNLVIGKLVVYKQSVSELAISKTESSIWTCGTCRYGGDMTSSSLCHTSTVLTHFTISLPLALTSVPFLLQPPARCQSTDKKEFLSSCAHAHSESSPPTSTPPPPTDLQKSLSPLGMGVISSPLESRRPCFRTSGIATHWTTK